MKSVVGLKKSAAVFAILIFGPVSGLAVSTLSVAPAVSAGLSSGDTAGELTELEKASIRLECDNVSKEYAYYLDTADYEGMPNAFAEDGVWEVLNNKMEGRAAIKAYWKSRTALWGPNDGWSHLISNQRINVVDRDHATGVAYFSVYKYDKRAGANKMLSPLVISRSEDEYVRTPEGWRIKHRKIFRVADVGN